MRLIITGGAGFIGSNFIRMWLDGHPADEILNFDLLTYAGDASTLEDTAARAGHRYRLVKGDIADEQAVGEVMRSFRPEAVVNFAAESHNSRALLDAKRFVHTNVVGTQVLLESVRRHGIARFHHVSTCEVYGELELDSPGSFTETSPYRPRTPYNASKAAADHFVRAYHLTFGTPATISNCSNNYGPWQHPEKVIPLFTTSAIEGRRLPLYRNSQNRREWLHVDDHCRAIALILERGRIGETYNVGSGDERSIEDLADAVLRLAGRPASLKTYVDDRPGHDKRYLLDHTKLREELGWRPLRSFEDGLRDTFEWYRSNRAWWSRKRALDPVDEFSWSTDDARRGAAS